VEVKAHNSWLGGKLILRVCGVLNSEAANEASVLL
jgi:hypothetical protein